MQTAYNVIIDHDYLGAGDETYTTVTTRGEALAVIRADRDSFTGDRTRWRAFIEEVFVFDGEAVEQEARRVQWHAAEKRSVMEGQRVMLELASDPDYEPPPPPMPTEAPVFKRLDCRECGWSGAVHRTFPYPGRHPNPRTGRACRGDVEVTEIEGTISDPYGNPVLGPGADGYDDEG
jgi:hypothetical protein